MKSESSVQAPVYDLVHVATGQPEQYILFNPALIIRMACSWGQSEGIAGSAVTCQPEQ